MLRRAQRRRGAKAGDRLSAAPLRSEWLCVALCAIGLLLACAAPGCTGPGLEPPGDDDSASGSPMVGPQGSGGKAATGTGGFFSSPGTGGNSVGMATGSGGTGSGAMNGGSGGRTGSGGMQSMMSGTGGSGGGTGGQQGGTGGQSADEDAGL